ncbi:hypothetical protein L6452_16080 [Arctium lappa]|uniref:Uncharacterized protein n=1 Tax=Arctium lappa TaxID=4217 RepID=A0ACB9BZN0_ARCLA|nr:hypothetical protein L6452_16080 [Arctium lappa]
MSHQDESIIREIAINRRASSNVKKYWFGEWKSSSIVGSSSQSAQQEEKKKGSILSFKDMLKYPLKVHRSMTKRSVDHKKLKIMVLEGDHDPRDEEIITSFRQMLFLDGLLPQKHNDYHTLIRHGRPLYIERIGMVDLNVFLQTTSIDRFVKYHVSEQEKTLKSRFPACSIAAHKHIASTTSILDVKNVVLGSNYKNDLIEAIDPSNLPSFFGGNCECSDYGGCLLSDKGPWNNPEIMAMLQEMTDSGDDNDGQTSGASNSKVSESDMDDIVIKDVYDITNPTENRGDENKLSSRSLEAVLNDASMIFQKLEDALNDAKLVLQTLAQNIEQLKRSNH